MNAAELRGASKPSLDEALGWVGSRVDDIYGAGVGRLEDVWIDPGTGMPRWLLVKEGRFGGRTTLIPFEDATAGAGHVWIPYERDVVRDAPRVQPGAPLTKKLESELRDHYSAASPGEQELHRSYAESGSSTGQRSAAASGGSEANEERVPVAAHQQYSKADGDSYGGGAETTSAAFGAPPHGEADFSAPPEPTGRPPEPQRPPTPRYTSPVAAAPPPPAPSAPAPTYYAPPAPQVRTPAPAWSPPYQPPAVQPVAPPAASYTPPPAAFQPQASQPPSMQIRDLGRQQQQPFQPAQPESSGQATRNGSGDEQPAAIPVIQALDRPQRVEIELTGGIKISGELTGFSLTPVDEDPS